MGAHSRSEVGLVGLGVMGRNLALNLADHGVSVVGWDQDPAKGQALLAEGAGKPVEAASDVEALLAKLPRPRTLILLVPAGKPVDAVVDSLLPRLDRDDGIIDGGNSQFRDTERRQALASAHGIHYLGMGVSGGEEGARRGPSLMPGGDRPLFDRSRAWLEAVAAKVNGEPCVAYLGPKGSGHYTKMVHNGIEYGLMQLIAESYDLLKRVAGLAPDEIGNVFARWNEGELNSFLLEVSAKVLHRKDERTGGWLVEAVRDVARQKGTGKWTVLEALDLQSPAPTIETAVGMRDLSSRVEAREAVARCIPLERSPFRGDAKRFIEEMREAYEAASLIAYAQGMALLSQASRTYEYDLDIAAVARVWRGGCIIRAGFLDAIATAYRKSPSLPHLLAEESFGPRVAKASRALRSVVQAAAELACPTPALMTSLAYADSLREPRLPLSLVQAQRDAFGAHGYERWDAPGTFHSDWGK